MNTITDIKEVNELRTLSLNLFNKHGYPTRKDEDWKQSQLNYFLENNKKLEIYKANNEPINEKVFENFKHNKIIIVNGLVQKTDFVHVMVNGTIVKTGCSKLAQELDKIGYKEFQKAI